jgi:hypothetical protein
MELTAPHLPATLLQSLAASRIANATITWLESDAVPQPYRRLLVHDRDMTSALARYHHDSIALQVLHCEQFPDRYLREVVLRTAGSGKPVEYGLIEILLPSFPAMLHPRILSGEVPLGTLLNESGMPYWSMPQGFFHLPESQLRGIFSPYPAGKMLYGRYNHLIHEAGHCLARIFEILPNETETP